MKLSATANAESQVQDVQVKSGSLVGYEEPELPPASNANGANANLYFCVKPNQCSM